jgi:hypothetical protein
MAAQRLRSGTRRAARLSSTPAAMARGERGSASLGERD